MYVLILVSDFYHTSIFSLLTKNLHDDTLYVRYGSRCVMSWTCDPVLALGQRFYSLSRRIFYCNALGKGFTVHYLVFSNGT